MECLAIGAGILGCGGGGDPNMGQQTVLRLLKQGKEIKIVNPFRCSAYILYILCVPHCWHGNQLVLMELRMGNGIPFAFLKVCGNHHHLLIFQIKYFASR